MGRVGLALGRRRRLVTVLLGVVVVAGDIFIHGRSVSIGCLAIGDAAIEELYLLVADVGLERTRLVLAPSARPAVQAGAPPWVVDLYARLSRVLADLRRSAGPGD